MGQMTILAGPERRRRWSEEERLRILAEAFAPGASVTEVARRHDVSRGLIYQWRRDARQLAEAVAVISLVRQQDTVLAQAIEQRLGLLAIAGLAFGQMQAHRPALGIDKRVDLGRQAASGTSHAAILIPLFRVAPCWWTRTQLLSII